MDKRSARTTAATVRATMPFLSGDVQGGLLEGELTFDPTDPYAVAMHLTVKSGIVTWTFARELLAEGLYEPAGDGDVQVWPFLSYTGNAVVIIELSSPDGDALLQAPARDVHDFVASTFKIVAAGEESTHLAMDAMISQLLAS